MVKVRSGSENERRAGACITVFHSTIGSENKKRKQAFLIHGHPAIQRGAQYDDRPGAPLVVSVPPSNQFLMIHRGTVVRTKHRRKQLRPSAPLQTSMFGAPQLVTRHPGGSEVDCSNSLAGVSSKGENYCYLLPGNGLQIRSEGHTQKESLPPWPHSNDSLAHQLAEMQTKWRRVCHGGDL